MLQSFALKLIIAALENEKIRALLLECVDRAADVLLPKLAALIPAAVGAGMKGLGDLLDGIDLPDIDQVVENIRAGVNQQLPDGIDIPILSDAFRNTTGLDLSDILLGRRR